MSRRKPSKKQRARERRAAERRHQTLEQHRTARGLAPDGTEPRRVYRGADPGPAGR